MFNGSNWDFYFLSTDLQTGNQQLLGIADSTGTKLQSIPCSPGGFFWAHPWSPNTGTERTNYSLQYSFSQRYNNTKGVTSFLTLPFTLESSLPGLNDVIVGASATVNVTAKTFNVTLVNGAGVDIGAVYSTALAVAGAWVGTGTARWSSYYKFSDMGSKHNLSTRLFHNTCWSNKLSNAYGSYNNESGSSSSTGSSRSGL